MWDCQEDSRVGLRTVHAQCTLTHVDICIMFVLPCGPKAGPDEGLARLSGESARDSESLDDQTEIRDCARLRDCRESHRRYGVFARGNLRARKDLGTHGRTSGQTREQMNEEKDF